MRSLFAIAGKDLRVLPRIPVAFFFTFIWPVIVAVMFGYAFGGTSSSRPRAMAVALVDDDATNESRAFVERLTASGNFAFTPMTRTEAEAAVRNGRQAAYFVIRSGFGERSSHLFYGPPREVEVGSDPSRQAEAGMINGLLQEAAAADMQRAMGDAGTSTKMVDEALAGLAQSGDAPAELTGFLGALKTFVNSPSAQASAGGASEWRPLKIVEAPVIAARRGPSNTFAITFPQGILWALIGCTMSFALSLVSERTRGTFVRLQMSPLSRAQILAGKALACAVAMTVVQTLLMALAVTVFGITPSSWPLLIVACLSSTIAFCGLMMLISTLGRTEQAASGMGWAILMPMSMLGGGMVPSFVMPAWMADIGVISPIRWAIRAIEGGLWRDFTPSEMLLPCAVLIATGVVTFALGTARLRGEQE
ncbi:MAG: ABC transporter permease [Acidobacteria bacterium]|nr:ABC transporter permease [Acidobacteriota bacterium]